MLAIVGASGKLGYATLTALLQHNLIPKTEIVACTSSHPGSTTWTKLANHGVQVRHADFDNPDTFKAAFTGVRALYLVSTPQIELDYNDAPHGQGRESRHFSVIDAARATGVKHIYYTSLAFGRPSVAGVMRAHIRTEEYLESLTDIDWTVIREGLYNESWPLYLGYFDVDGGDERDRIVVAGDGLINWTAIEDLGLGNALILAAPKSQYVGKTLYLSTNKNVKTLRDIATLVGEARGRDLALQVVSRKEHVETYVNQKGMDQPAVEWWVSSYEALDHGETHICDDDTLDQLLSSKNINPKSMESTIKMMLSTT